MRPVLKVQSWRPAFDVAEHDVAPLESSSCPWNLNAAGGLLLLRHVTPLSRRDVVYFHSGAHKWLRAQQDFRIQASVVNKKRGFQLKSLFANNLFGTLKV